MTSTDEIQPWSKRCRQGQSEVLFVMFNGNPAITQDEILNGTGTWRLVANEDDAKTLAWVPQAYVRACSGRKGKAISAELQRVADALRRCGMQSTFMYRFFDRSADKALTSKV